MEFHATLVALVNGKLQGVVAGGATALAGEAGVPRLQTGRVEGGGANARLKKYGVDMRSTKTVEDVAKLLLLALYRLGEVAFTLGQSRLFNVVSHTARTSCFGTWLKAHKEESRKVSIKIGVLYMEAFIFFSMQRYGFCYKWQRVFTRMLKMASVVP